MIQQGTAERDLIRRGTTVHHRGMVISYGRGIVVRDQERTPLGRPAADVWVMFDRDVTLNCPRKVLVAHLTLEARPGTSSTVVPCTSAAAIVP